MTYEAMTPQCARSMFQVLVIRVCVGVASYTVIYTLDVSGSGPV